MKQTLSKLKDLLTKKDKKFIIFLVFFSIIISIIETLGISIIMPFMAVATDFNIIHENKYYELVFNYFNFEKEINFVIIIGLGLAVFYIFRSLVNLLYFYMLAKFSKGRYHLIAYRLFENYLGMSYHNFIKKNSSTLTKTIIQEAAGLTEVLSSILFMISEIFIIIFIYILMLMVNYKITLVLTLILFIKALFLTKVISSRLKKIGIETEKVTRNFYEIINRTFGNFKLIKLNSNDKDVLNSFGEASFRSAQLSIKYTTFSHIPRLFLEAVGFGIIALIITYLVWKNGTNISHDLPVLSMFVLSLYRLMPSVNRIMTSYNQIMYYNRSLDIVHTDLMYDSENLGNDNIEFCEKIHLKDLCFEYKENNPILRDINLIINKGDKIAFIGESGSGKSTIVDIIIGLYKPISGNINIDNSTLNDSNIKKWRKKIGYIPQSVYLFDGTVGANIAFGNEYNEDKIIQCLKSASIYNFLQEKEGLATLVGEGGIMLSGGQKQRIAIARALYLDPEILVLDEATSALDNETEAKIMNEIYNLSKDKTLIIIAHRLSTIKRCEYVYKIKDGKLLNGE